jgi:amino acid transporter
VLAEEVKDPKRTIPVAITVSIGVVSALYFSVCLAFFGLWKYTEDHNEVARMEKAPLVYAFNSNDQLRSWMPYLVGVAAILCSANATFGTTQGQPRVFYCMARDGLLPERFASVEKKSMVPKVAIFATACITVPLALFIKFKYLEGTIVSGILMLQAFVCLGCLVRRAQLRNEQNGARVIKEKQLYGGMMVFSLSAFLTAFFFVRVKSAVLPGIFGGCAFLACSFCLYSMGTAGWTDAVIPLAGVFVNIAFMGTREYPALLGLLSVITVSTVYYLLYSVKHSSLVSDTTTRN